MSTTTATTKNMRTGALSPKLLLPITEAARLLGVSSSTVRRLIAAGRLRTINVGKELRVPVAAIEEFVAPAPPSSGSPA